MAGANRLLARLPIALSRDELQAALESRFPRTLDGLLRVEVGDPLVRLDAGSGRLGIELTFTPLIGGERVASSRWLFDGEVSYRRESGEFFLHKPDLTPLGDGPGAGRGALQGLVRRFAMTEIVDALFPSVPLYQLSATEPRQALARRLLSSVSVEDGRLLLHLQFD